MNITSYFWIQLAAPSLIKKIKENTVWFIHCHKPAEQSATPVPAIKGISDLTINNQLFQLMTLQDRL